MSESDSRGQAARWLPAARQGSQGAIGQALQACRGYLIQIAQRELGADLQPKGGASDLVQQTMIDAVRDFARFQGDTEAELLQWLRRLLLNNVADFGRQYREAGKRQVDREVGLGPANSSGAPEHVLPAGTATPSRVVAAHEESERVRQAVGRLPDDYKRVITLRYEDGKSFEEIGALLGLTPNAARKLLIRAVERVRREMESPS